METRTTLYTVVLGMGWVLIPFHFLESYSMEYILYAIIVPVWFVGLWRVLDDIQAFLRWLIRRYS